MSHTHGAVDHESEDDNDIEDDGQFPDPRTFKHRQRGSVSAEANSATHAMHFVPPSIVKSPDIEARILEKLEMSFLFSSLDIREKQVIVSAMEIIDVSPGQLIIEQGTEGDSMYVVDSGVVDCFKSSFGEEQLVQTISASGIFGELALLYNCPRAASVICRETAILYKLDRNTFNCVVKGAATRKRHQHESFLKSVPILRNLDSTDIARIAEALKTKSYVAGDYIIRQGEIGNEFYMLEEGRVIATKLEDGVEKTVNGYGPNEYFGELALMKDELRAANIIAETNVTVLELDGPTFKRLLGSLDMLPRDY